MHIIPNDKKKWSAPFLIDKCMSSLKWPPNMTRDSEGMAAQLFSKKISCYLYYLWYFVLSILFFLDFRTQTKSLIILLNHGIFLSFFMPWMIAQHSMKQYALHSTLNKADFLTQLPYCWLVPRKIWFIFDKWKKAKERSFQRELTVPSTKSQSLIAIMTLSHYLRTLYTTTFRLAVLVSLEVQAIYPGRRTKTKKDGLKAKWTKY